MSWSCAPEVAAYHNKLAQGLADRVRANGTEITSVFYYGDRKVVDSIDFKVAVYNRRCIASHLGTDAK